jgi:hypothetical protein
MQRMLTATFILIQQVVSKINKNKFRIEESIGSFIGRKLLDEFATHYITSI